MSKNGKKGESDTLYEAILTLKSLDECIIHAVQTAYAGVHPLGKAEPLHALTEEPGPVGQVPALFRTCVRFLNCGPWSSALRWRSFSARG